MSFMSTSEHDLKQHSIINQVAITLRTLTLEISMFIYITYHLPRSLTHDPALLRWLSDTLRTMGYSTASAITCCHVSHMKLFILHHKYFHYVTRVVILKVFKKLTIFKRAERAELQKQDV